MSGADGGSGTIILRFLDFSTGSTGGSTGGGETDVIGPGLQIKIGNHFYSPALGSFSVDNSIGERGTCSFQLWQKITKVASDVPGAFSNGGHFVSSYPDLIGPEVGTPIIFTGATPTGIIPGTTYYVVYRHTGLPNYFQISDTIGGTHITWTLTNTLATVWDEYILYSFYIGENIKVYIEGDLVWSGIIERINKQLPKGQSFILFTIRGISWNYACDKRRIVAAYSTDVTSGLSARYIVDDIVTNYLKGEGISTGYISTGANFGNVVFNYVQPSKCLDILAEQSGYIWQINPDKTLDFKPHDFSTIAFSVGSTEMLVDNIQYTESNPKYRNIQYVTGGYELTSTQNEYAYGDDQKQVFTVAYSVMKAPYINVVEGGTSSQQAIGILGVDTTHQWFWNKYSNLISQNTSDTPLSTEQLWHIQYIGGYPSVAISQNTTAIALRRSYEGGTGIVEDVLPRGKETLFEENQTLGAQLITKYSTITDTLTFRTRTKGITPGKILNVTFPEFDLSTDEMLVDSVKIKDDPEGNIWYNISALMGPEHGGWSRYFDEFMTRTIEKDIWLNSVTGDIITFTTSFAETFTWTEATTESIFTCPLPCAAASSTTFYPESTYYPC